MLVTIDGFLVEPDDVTFTRDLNSYLNADKEWHVVGFAFDDSDYNYLGKTLTATVYAIKRGQMRHNSFSMSTKVDELNVGHALRFASYKDKDIIKLLCQCE